MKKYLFLMAEFFIQETLFLYVLWAADALSIEQSVIFFSGSVYPFICAITTYYELVALRNFIDNSEK